MRTILARFRTVLGFLLAASLVAPGAARATKTIEVDQDGTPELIDPNTGHVWRAAKRGFCMLDLEKYGAYLGPNNNDYKFRSCGAVGVPGNQGISKGWSDVYWWKLQGQYFVLDGGDGQAVVPP